MKRFTLFLLLGLLAGCEAGEDCKLQIDDCKLQIQAIDIPPELRTENYTVGRGRRAKGSCLHVAAQDLLRWQGLSEQADYWRQNFGGPASIESISAIADKLGLDYAYTDAGDEWFLDYCHQTRSGAAIYWYVDRPGDHAIVFCGWENDQAVLLGVNRPQVSRIPKAEFLALWRRCGGCAFTFVTSH